ncbi:hypothetical protein MMC25_000425 [Agyrium rufum]|nr:hypothetical protein [Agyrium rufum]
MEGIPDGLEPALDRSLPEVTFEDDPEPIHNATVQEGTQKETVINSMAFGASEQQVEVGILNKKKEKKNKKRWVLFGITALMIAIVSSVVGGILGHHSRVNPSSMLLPVLPSSPTLTPALQDIFRVNTSITALNCEAAGNWIFVQSKTGSIRALSSGGPQSLSSVWSFEPKDLNFTEPLEDTPLAASCVNVPSDTAYPPSGLYISLLYLDINGDLRQSTYSDGIWNNSEVYQGPPRPATGTHLGSTTEIIPNGNTTAGESSLISSFAIYQSTDESLQFINAVPQAQNDANINPPFLNGKLNDNGSSLSVVSNAPVPDSSSALLYTRAANAIQVSSIVSLQQFSVRDSFWVYESSLLANASAVFPGSRYCDYFNASAAGDVTFASMSSGSTVRAYLTFNNTPAAVVTEPSSTQYLPVVGNISQVCDDPHFAPATIPTTRFGASACGYQSIWHCIYYIVNSRP